MHEVILEAEDGTSEDELMEAALLALAGPPLDGATKTKGVRLNVDGTTKEYTVIDIEEGE